MSDVIREAGIGNRIFWLRDFPVLSAIPDDIWEKMLAASRVVDFPAGTPLIQCGDAADKFVIILHGCVKVFEVAEDGREICLFRVHKGQVCALTLLKLLVKPNQRAQAVAEDDVRLLVSPVENYELLMAQSGTFRNYLMASMANCLNEMMQLVGQISFQRLDLRLASLLGELSVNRSTRKLSITHQEIANELGTSREVVSRLLKEFEVKGCLGLHRGSIELLCEDGLHDLLNVAEKAAIAPVSASNLT